MITKRLIETSNMFKIIYILKQKVMIFLRKKNNLSKKNDII